MPAVLVIKAFLAGDLMFVSACVFNGPSSFWAMTFPWVIMDALEALRPVSYTLHLMNSSSKQGVVYDIDYLGKWAVILDPARQSKHMVIVLGRESLVND
jgi:hypothetical protein